MSTSKDKPFFGSISSKLKRRTKWDKSTNEPTTANPSSSSREQASSSQARTSFQPQRTSIENAAPPPVPTVDSAPTTISATSVPSQDRSRRLNCLIKGESIVFLVTVERDCVVSELKEEVKGKRALGTLKDVDPHTLELWKVDIDLEPHDEHSLSHLKLEELEDVEKLTWKSMEKYWSHQPPIMHLHIIVKNPAIDIGGKRATPPPVDADYSKRGFSSKELIVVIPIEGEQFLDHLLLEVRPWNRIVAVHNRTRDELRMIWLVGEFFRFNLEILPLPTTPTMIELRELNLAELQAKAHRQPEDFPAIPFAKFFNRFYVEGQQDPCVHFLVWLPPEDQRFPEDPTPAISWFISSSLKALLNFEDATIASRSREDMQSKFKLLLKHEYHQLDDGKLFDMATGTCLPHSIVVASHIFQYKWRNELPRFTSLTDINDSRNGLLLYKPVEWAFDRAKICVEVKSHDEMTFRLLDQDLHDIVLADKACDLRNEAKCGNKRLLEEMNLQMTFGDLDGQPLKFPKGVVMRPSKRMLGLHAVLAQWAAQDRVPQHRIRDVAYDTSGDEITERAIKNYSIITWRNMVEHGVPFD